MQHFLNHFSPFHRSLFVMTCWIHCSNFKRVAAPPLVTAHSQLWDPSSHLKREARPHSGQRSSQRNPRTSYVLCGVLTDLNLHRFTLHQHLTTNESLTETPLLHQPFQEALPLPLQRLVQRYHTNLNLTMFTFVVPWTPLNCWDASHQAPTSATLTSQQVTSHPPQRHHSQQPVVCCPANLCNFHLQYATIYPPSPHTHWSFSILPHRPHLRTLPPIKPNKPTSSSLSLLMRNSRPATRQLPHSHPD